MMCINEGEMELPIVFQGQVVVSLDSGAPIKTQLYYSP